MTSKTPRWIECAVAEIMRTKFKPSFIAAELEAILVKHAPKRTNRVLFRASQIEAMNEFGSATESDCTP